MRTVRQIIVELHRADRDGASLPAQLCLDCAEALDLTGAAMSLVNDDGPQAVIGASGPLARELEQLQIELGEGPAVDASRLDRAWFQPYLDRHDTTRWPGFAPAALDAGIQALFALPLQVGAVRVGSLSLYRSRPGVLGDAETTAAFAYAQAALVVVLHLQAGTHDHVLPTELSVPLENHWEVHQATGYLSVTASVSLSAALLLLRAHAFASERPLLQVARDVLAGRIHISPGEDHDGDDDDRSHDGTGGGGGA